MFSTPNPRIWPLCLASNVEDVQHRATKLLGHLKEKSYPERLRVLKFPKLEHRRRRGDMIEVYKYLHGHYKVEKPAFILATTTDLRGHKFKLQKNRFRLNIRGNFFSQRTINDWNSLPEEVVSALTINSFKNQLDDFWNKLSIIYEPQYQHF